jgi:hypothetical protein
MALTQAKALGGTLEATWFETSLADMFPDTVAAIGAVAEGMTPLLDALQVALNLVAGAQQAAVILPEIPNAALLVLDAAIAAAIQIVIDQVENLRNAGHALILLPVTPGGYKGAARTIRSALLNTRDNQRPSFTPGATVAGWGVIAAADVGTIQKIVDAFQALFLASDKLAAQSNVVKATISLNFPDPFAAQKVAGRPAPQNTPQWLRVRIVDLIPGADDAFDNLIGALKSLRPPPITLPILDYLDFLNRIIARIKAVLLLVTAFVVLLRALFVDIPVKIIEFDAQFGSTQDIADSIPAWFNTSQPILSDVPDDLHTCGIFAVIGSEDPFTPGLQMDLLRTLILP